MLKNMNDNAEVKDKAIEHIEKAVDNSGAIINNLLNFSRASSKEGETIDIEEHQITDVAQPQHPEKEKYQSGYNMQRVRKNVHTGGVSGYDPDKSDTECHGCDERKWQSDDKSVKI